ncbi:MAG: putative glycoside hydrolase [Solirubrobacteraceae bacterium]
MAIDNNVPTADFTKTPARSSVVVLQEWEKTRLHDLKAANPAIKVLMYKNLSSMLAASPNGNAGTGVTTQEAESHPDWYLKNTSGAKFNFWGYDYLWAADIGLRSFQDRWAANVLAKLKADSWDGVFVDDTNPTIRYHYNPESVQKYPTDAAYSAATGSALAVIGPALRAQGKLVIPNMGSWRDYRTAVSSWLPYVSGGMEEQFTKWGNDPATGYMTGADWDRQLALVKETQAAGKYVLLVSHSTAQDANAARYGWATTLLAGTGTASYSLAENYNGESWFTEYDYDLGKAVGAETKLSSGVHKRVFERGIVLVNPTLASVPVSFGARYRGSGLSLRSSTTMAPHTGLILLKEGVAAPKAPAPAVAAAEPAPAAPAAGVELAAQPVAPSAAVAIAPPASKSTVRPVRRVVVKVRCRSAKRCHRVVHVVLGRSAVVGRRNVTVRARRSARIAVSLDARGRKALAQGKRLRTLVRASV